jgi:hypothetical protein
VRLKQVIVASCTNIITNSGYPVAWPNLPVLGEISPNPASEESFAFVENLLSGCSGQHKICRAITSFLPKRILDVERFPETIRLVETRSNSTGKYVALSYCWGTPGPPTTKISSLKERLLAIQVSSLPMVFTDAISLTRKLGLRYIWIDSLCIIQDSIADWDIESAKMASIYEQAYLTIAASSSPSCDKAFLLERNGSLAIDCLDDIAQPSIVKARQIPEVGIHDRSLVPRDPWDQRAWTLQEKLLSARLVSFYSDEIQWRCKTQSVCECAVRPLLDWRECPGSIFRLHNDRHAYMFWHVQVMEYTNRQSTFPEDKLPALSGVARSIYNITNSEYFAGLWMDNFLMDLCWKRILHPEEWEPPWVLPPSYRAPSFSWASVEGHVFYPEESFYDKWTWHASTLGKSLNLSGNNLFGKVERSSVTIWGPIFSASISSLQENPEYEFEYSLWWDVSSRPQKFQADVMLEEFTFATPCGISKRSARRSPTSVEHILEEVPVGVLSLGHCVDLEGGIVTQYCLVLGTSPTDSASYERLGLLRLIRITSSWDWEEFVEETAYQTVTIN